MAKKLFSDVEEEEIAVAVESPVVAKEPRVKQMIRFISNVSGPDQTAITDVDRQLSEYVNAGWKLFNTHFIGIDSEGHYRVLYILTKD